MFQREFKTSIMEKVEIKVLQQHYEKLSAQLLELLRTNLLTEGSQELHEAKLNYDRWLSKSHVLKLVLNEA